jgi:acetolactate synthase-1/2/3 large subunit
VLNNLGYESIRSTQNNFFESRHVGSDFKSGIANPDFRLLAAAYGFAYDCINNNDELHKIEQVLKIEGPVLCELKLSPDQPRSPKTMSVRKPDGTMESRPIEDLFPFLPREEVYENMHLFDEAG